MSVLTKAEITDYMKRELGNRLIVTPLMDATAAFDPSSINVRIGNEFIIMRKQAFPLLDISNQKELNANIMKYQDKIRLRYGDKIVLHPGQLVIGSTFEYICIPKDLMCYVVGKSTWGRMGLIIATATKVDPGFKGCITLEIINEGEVPIVVKPGIPIAQLVFHKTLSDTEYTGRYDCPTGPQFPKFKVSTVDNFFLNQKKR